MLTIDPRRRAASAAARRSSRLRVLRFLGCLTAVLAGGLLASACNGDIGQNNPTGTGGSMGIGGMNVKPGDVTVPPTPISADAAYVAVRKVKTLLTGMAPTDEDVALVT